jgi:hypothetical protein
MPNLMDLIQDQFNEDLIGTLSNSIGAKDSKSTAVASQTAASFLMNALAKNASSPEGLNALSGALDRDHDGSVLDDIMGLISNQSQPTNNKAFNGMGILKHVLGGKQDTVVDAISKSSGLDKNSSMSLLIKMAPVVMGMLGKQKRSNNLDGSGLFDLLVQSKEQTNQQLDKPNLIERMLDQDGDGSMMDDLAKMGMRNISKFFRR